MRGSCASCVIKDAFLRKECYIANNEKKEQEELMWFLIQNYTNGKLKQIKKGYIEKPLVQYH